MGPVGQRLDSVDGFSGMGFPSLDSLRESLLGFLEQREILTEPEIRYVASPYRICPLGAHVDHQGGSVLGQTINAYSLLAFVPAASPEVRLHSLNFPGVTVFRVDEPGPPDAGDWGRYARGAAHVLGRSRPLRFGLVGAVAGTLPQSGLSSSTSVGLAYLLALAAANDRELSAAGLVELGRQLENDYVGVGGGVLDQSTIVHGREGSLVHIRSRERSIEHVPNPHPAGTYRVLIAYSGYSRELSSTGFNERVRECRQAARLLGERVGLSSATILSDVPVEAYRANRDALPAHLMRRVKHFYSEVDRVEQGRIAWAGGDLFRFGTLMDESCQSSIHNYECGSAALRALHEIVSSTEGVYGSRFSGGGYGGCVVGVVDTASEEAAVGSIRNRYARAEPEARGRTRICLARSESAVRFL